MSEISKITLLAAFVLICVSLASSSTSEQAIGMGQEVEVGVDRGNHGIMTGLSIYCRTYELDACENGFGLTSVPSTLWHYVTVEDPEEWYQENNGDEGSDVESVQHFNLS